MNYDALIIGSGPAGMASAISLLRAGRKISILDYSGKIRSKQGQSLPPGASPCLEKLGLARSLKLQNHIPIWSISSSWGTPQLKTQELAFHPYGNAWILNQAEFQFLLEDTVKQAGGEYLKLSSNITANYSINCNWTVLVGGQTITSKFIIDATGRSSFFAKRFGAQRKSTDRLVALTAYVPSSSATREIIVESAANGWWYACPGWEENTIIQYFSDADLIPSSKEKQKAFYGSALSDTVHIKEVAEGTLFKELTCCLANSSYLDFVYGDGWLATGDAACSFDPLSSNGLTNAFETGRLAGTTVHAFLSGETRALDVYSCAIRDIFQNVDIAKLAYYGLEKRWSTTQFWKRRHSYMMHKIT